MNYITRTEALSEAGKLCLSLPLLTIFFPPRSLSAPSLLGWGEGALNPHSLPASGGRKGKKKEHFYVIQQNLFKTIPTFSLTVCFVVNIFETITNKVLFKKKKSSSSIPFLKGGLKWVGVVGRRGEEKGQSDSRTHLNGRYSRIRLNAKIWEMIPRRTFVNFHYGINMRNIGAACLGWDTLPKICDSIDIP